MNALSSDVQEVQRTQSSVQYDVVVIGAGPYGLSTAAHLLGKGLKVAVFGKPLQLWRDYMPAGMFLRSHWWASNLSDPQKKYSFEKFFRASRYKACYPVPVQMFIDYGLWFQKNAVPDVDETYVSLVERRGEQFVLTLADGRVVISTSVVMAMGLKYYANIPSEYAHLPKDAVSHSFEYADFARFSGKKVAMIGGGQSAVEYSALLHEAGASVHLLTRRPIHWLDPDTDDRRSWVDQVCAPRAGIAPGWKNWVLEFFPYLFYRFPQPRKDRYTISHYAAAANDWLRERVFGKVEINERQIVKKMEATADGRVDLTLADNRRLKVDHVILATGYKVNIQRLTMLSQSLLSEIEADSNIPVLDHWFGTNVPGLYFLGLTSVRSFGPLYRFVVGTKAAAPRVASSVARYVAKARVR